ncbi:MAG: glycosyltransferase family 2 protein, partial [Bacillota bacterium]|nr:glycosyltransferase family 2 protein [Bacillota bacterium]
VEKICLEDPNVKLINFSRNFGHQMAITAGMDYASGNAIVIIDADLQDPPELIPKMLNVWKQGYDVVYGKRLKRKGETFFKKMTAKTYYRILKSMTTVDIPVDTGDFRLMDRKVCEALKSLPEKNRYVRGLVSWVGFKQTALEYERDERFAGETKYPLKKMFKLAYDGIAGFSYKPLKFAAYIGTVVSLVSFISLIVIIIKKIIFPGSTIWGWSSLMVINLFFNGLVLIMLGVIGEYIGRIYDEAKGRPMYIVASKKGFKEK